MLIPALIAVASANPCEDYNRPRLLLRLQAPDINESSGLAASRLQDGVFYTHNDSGDEARLFRFSTDGGRVLTFPLQGATARDWEGMAAGPCPEGGDCLFVGDIGDNLRQHDRIQVWAFREIEGGVESTPAASWSVRYPDGAEDAEVLLVHPTTGRIYLVTKESRSPQVFRFPQNPGEGVLERVAVLSEERLGLRLPKLTGGDFSREGDRVILRGYLSAWEWAVQLSDPEAHWSEPPLRSVPLRLERQGEALTFDLTGRVFTSSEGSPMPLTRIGCRD